MKRLFCIFGVRAGFLFLSNIVGVFAGCLLFFASCGDDDSSNEIYAVIASDSFVFDESDAAANTVRVTANGAWSVYWEPASAAVSVDPSSGFGDGTFRVRDMPAGTSVEIGVRTASGGNSVGTITVTRAAAPGEVRLSVAPAELDFDPLGTNRIAVASNASWRAACPDPALEFSPASGTGDGTITVTAAPEGVRCMLTVTAGEGGNVRTQRVEIFRKPDVSDRTVFSLDFGDGAGQVWTGNNDEWKTQTGTGASTVTYSAYNVRINNDNFGSAGKYAGASGKAYAKMFYDAATDYFAINDIALPEGVCDYTLAFGAIFPADDVSLMVSTDGGAWQPLTYTAAAAYNVWSRATVGFTLRQAVAKLSIRLAPTGTTRQYGLNFDDIILTTGGGGQEVGSAPEAESRWAELPANWVAPAGDVAARKDDYAFFTHWSKSVSSKKTVRNYSYCYDTRRHNPVWVAYPLHAVYREGGTGRTNPDPWAPDPALDEALQSKIYKSAGDGTGIYDGYQFWSTQTMKLLGVGGYWSKGHLCMSSERGGADSEINMQTFHPTNIAPQSSAGASDFATVWSYVESLFSGTNDYKGTDFTADDGRQNLNIVADTLYLVAGCYYEHDDWKEYDASNSDYDPSTCTASKLCIMPTHQFKMALRTKKGNTGKRIVDCTADELQAIGFWIEAFPSGGDASAAAELKKRAVPVSDIEKKMGFEFFPDVPASVKQSFDPADWGF